VWLLLGAGVRTARITGGLSGGADPAAIPFELPDKTNLALNRATAAAIGVTLPEDLKLRADHIFG